MLEIFGFSWKPTQKSFYGWGVVLWGAILGCGDGSPDIPSLSPAAAASQAMTDFDANGDGTLDAKELEKAPGLQAALKSIDKDNSKTISSAELQDRIEAYRKDAIAFIQLDVHVSLNGTPVDGAQVTFTPEAFMGTDVKTAAGLTNRGGSASLRVEGEEFPGAHCGIYRVRISKKNSTGKESIPSRYNSETTLGQEVATDVADIERGVKFELKSP